MATYPPRSGDAHPQVQAALESPTEGLPLGARLHQPLSPSLSLFFFFFFFSLFSFFLLGLGVAYDPQAISPPPHPMFY